MLNLKIASSVAQNFKGSPILLDYLRTPMSIPAPVLKTQWQKKKKSQHYQHFKRKKSAHKNI